MKLPQKILPFFFLFALFGVQDAHARCWSTLTGQETACPCLFACESNGFDHSIGQTSGVSAPADNEADPRAQNNLSCRADPVYLHSGEFFYQCNDLSVPGRKLDVDIGHTYFSGISFNGPFGYGWVLNYHLRLHRLRNGDAVILTGDGRKNRYTLSGSTYTPPPGRFETLIKNPDNTWILTQAHGEKYHFGADGKIVSIQDRNNNTTAFSYDATRQTWQGRAKFGQDPLNKILIGLDDRLNGITASNGRSITLDYNDDGLLYHIVDAGRQVTFAYDPSTNDLLSVTKPATTQFPLGVTKSFVYEDHNVKKVRDPKLQYFVENFYDAAGRVEEQALGGNSFAFDYSVPGQVTETDRMANQIVYTFNSSGNMLSKEERTRGLRFGDPASFLTSYTYNDASLMTSTTYPKGNGVKFVYDEAMATGTQGYRAAGNLLAVRLKGDMTLADNDTNDIRTLYTYESGFNLVKTATDPKGQVTTNTYFWEENTPDPDYNADLGRVVLPTFQHPDYGPVTPEINFTYNSYGQVTQKTDAGGNVTQYAYSPTTGYLQNLIRDPAGVAATTSLTYDTFGNIDTVTDPEMHVTDYDYDALGWLNQVTNPRNYVTRYTYDANGNVTRIEKQASDPAGTWQTTQMTYDILNHLKTSTDPLNRVTTYNYNNNEKLESVVDAETNTTTYAYDERNLLFTVTDANTPAGVTQYGYDLNGNLAKIIDANSHATNYAYDLFDRLDITQYADLSEKNFDYDKNSNLDFVTLPGTHGTIDYVYDELNRLTAKRYPLTADLNTSYVYDAGSRLTDADNAAAQIHYVYDALGRVDTETQTINSINYTLNYDYYKNGLRKQLVYPSTKTLDYTYDADDELDIVKLNTVNFVDYDYDVLGRREQKSFLSPTLPLATYSYDLANQLSDVTNKLVDNTVISQYAYPLYDGVGNRKQLDRALGVNPAETINYAYNDIYELTDVAGVQTHSYDYDQVGNRELADGINYTPNNLNQYTNVNSVTFGYDDNGNLTSDGTNTYTFDEENRLASMTNASHTAGYAYDALNRRVSKVVGGTTTHFIYDDDDIIADYDGSNSLVAEYIHGDNVDEILTMERGGETYYYHSDGLGSLTEITNSIGNVVESYDYDPYGQPSIFDAGRSPLTTSAIGNRYLFTGREFDDESGVYHNRARARDPKIGGFLQRDPIGYADGMNLFEYAHNSPTNFVDPDGEFAFLALIPIAYAVIEIGLSASDAYSTGSTLLDPCASSYEKLLSTGLFIAGALAPGGGYSTAGNIGKNFTKAQIKQFERQMFERGSKSLEKSLKTFEKQLAVHQKKLEDIKKLGGYISSVEKEIRNFTQQINAIKKILRR